jgi:thiol-disulfide isomerase/thioredoxin
METTNMVRYVLVLALSLIAQMTLANEGGGHEAAAKKDEHAAGQNSGHGAEKKDEHGGGHESASAPAAPAVPQGPRREYNPGKVLPFPSFNGDLISKASSVSFKPRKGHAVMVIFISSWCEPCQVLMPELKQLAKKYSTASSEVYFVFAHDTKPDAAGFIKEHQLTAPAIISNTELLTDFKNPELPSVYVGDKWGYMADRFIKISKNDVDNLDDVMSKITAL